MQLRFLIPSLFSYLGIIGTHIYSNQVSNWEWQPRTWKFLYWFMFGMASGKRHTMGEIASGDDLKDFSDQVILN